MWGGPFAVLRTLLFRAEARALDLELGANLDFHADHARVVACSPLSPDVDLNVDLASGRVREVAGGGGTSSKSPRGPSSSGCSGGGGGGRAGAEPWAEEALAPNAAGRPGLGPALSEAAHAPMAMNRGGHAESRDGGNGHAHTAAWGSAAARPVPAPTSFLGSSLDPTSASMRKRCHAHGGFQCWVERVRAADGVLVPLTVARSVAASEPGPVMLVVYGAYGTPLDLSYCPEYASLLVRMLLSLVFLHGWGWQPDFRGGA